jgi:hypothetical protein
MRLFLIDARRCHSFLLVDSQRESLSAGIWRQFRLGSAADGDGADDRRRTQFGDVVADRRRKGIEGVSVNQDRNRPLLDCFGPLDPLVSSERAPCVRAIGSAKRLESGSRRPMVAVWIQMIQNRTLGVNPVSLGPLSRLWVHPLGSLMEARNQH